jgi:hypothetical protein
MKSGINLVFLTLGVLSINASAMSVRTALGMIETGADKEFRCAADTKRGRHREVSRYQILPDIFHRYTRSREYSNPDVAWGVAQRILEERKEWFQTKTGRKPSDFDLYLMWNAPGVYERAGFNAKRVPRDIRDRAQRFANLRSGPTASR